MALTFNHVLRSESIDPTDVQLVRHQDLRWKPRTPFHLWRDEPDKFEEYQRLQGKDRFILGATLASFIVPPTGETLFVGLYRVLAVREATPGHIDPVSRRALASHLFYDLERCTTLAEYKGRLVVDWGLGFRSWVQRAHLQDKLILELRKSYSDPLFPGYLRFMCSLSELVGLPQPWIDRLHEAKGVYVLTCPKTTEWYVGSATGAGGFFERWLQHLAKDGDAVGFRSRVPADYQVSILEVAGSFESANDIVLAEQMWMNKLQTRQMGLNNRALGDLS